LFVCVSSPVVEPDVESTSSRRVPPGRVLAPAGVRADPPLHGQIVLHCPRTRTAQATGFVLQSQIDNERRDGRDELIHVCPEAYYPDPASVRSSSVGGGVGVGWMDGVTPPPPSTKRKKVFNKNKMCSSLPSHSPCSFQTRGRAFTTLHWLPPLVRRE
jgi:hypothetical protein